MKKKANSMQFVQLVRASRELVNDNRVMDEFSNPKSYLRKWIGLNRHNDTQA